MSAPGTPTPAGPSAAAAAGSASPRPGQSHLTISTILQNLPNLFTMHAKGSLSELQVNQLRQLMHTHFRQVIAASVQAGKPNPLLSLPPALDPTLPRNGRPPLISREAYATLIATATKQVEESLAARRALEGQAAAAGGEMNQFANQGAGGGAVPLPPPAGATQRTATPPIDSIVPLPHQLGHQQPQPGSDARQLQAAGTAQQKTPPGIFNIQQLGDLLRLTAEARQEWLAKDPSRATAFSMSLKYYSANRQNAASTPAAVRPGYQDNAAAGPSRAAPPPNALPPNANTQTQASTAVTPTTIAPSALLTPPIPPAPSAQAPSQQPTVPASGSTQPSTTEKPTDAEKSTTAPSGPNPVSVTAPSADHSTQQQASTTEPQGTPTAVPDGVHPSPIPAASGNTVTASTDPAQAVGVGAPLPSALANTQSTPAFMTAFPDPKSFALKPPPPPPEPEPVRRKRKFKEIMGELAPGVEMEVGVDEVLGEILDELLDEGLKGAVRLAKHRGSEKVELKDMAYFVDTHWDMSVPGFDALGHSHRKMHVPPERERRKGRAVVPRPAGGGARGGKRDDD